jgi:hypothetical protein
LDRLLAVIQSKYLPLKPVLPVVNYGHIAGISASHFRGRNAAEKPAERRRNGLAGRPLTNRRGEVAVRSATCSLPKATIKNTLSLNKHFFSWPLE